MSCITGHETYLLLPCLNVILKSKQINKHLLSQEMHTCTLDLFLISGVDCTNIILLDHISFPQVKESEV
jgi:hypothetical protein